MLAQLRCDRSRLRQSHWTLGGQGGPAATVTEEAVPGPIVLHTLVTAVLIVQTAGEALRGGRGSSSQGATVAASVMAKPGGAKPRRASKASAAARRIRSIRVAERVRRKSPKDNLVARAWPANYSGTHPTAISLIGPRPSPVLAGRSLLQSQHVALQRGLGSASRRHAWRR